MLRFGRRLPAFPELLFHHLFQHLVIIVLEHIRMPGAGHGFMRAGQMADASAENAKARQEAFAKLVAKLNAL